MFSAFRSRFLAMVLALFAVACSTGAASANWITIKNETGKTITVQETVMVNGQVKRGKATNLLAGETLREFVPGPTVKRVELFDAQSPNRSVWSGDLNCKDEHETFLLTASGGKIVVGHVVSPPKK